MPEDRPRRYAKYHSARLTKADYDNYAWNDDKFPGGIVVVFGIKGGKSEVHSIKFPKDKFTPEQSEAWLKEHDFTAISFMKAGEGNTDSIDNIAIFNKEFFDDKEFKTVEHYDRSAIPKAVITKEGFLRVDAAPVTRIGIFKYRNLDGTPKNMLRLADDVFDRQSLDTMKMIPITNGHPNKFVDAKNSKDLQIGSTGENITHDDNYVFSPVVVNREDSIQTIKKGKKELSLGYYADEYMIPGIWRGQKYDGIMKNFKYNHLAIVDSARAGSAVRLYIDEAEVNPINHNSKGGRKMPNIIIDGVSYESAQEVINRLTKFEKDNADLTKKLEDNQKEVEKITADRDEKKAKIDELEKKDHSKEINDAVQARIDLVGKVAKLFDEKELKEISDKTDREIKVMAINKVHKDLKLDEKSDDYVDARFEAVLENNDSNDNGTKQQKKQIGDATDNKGNKTEILDADESRKKMVDDMKSAYKNEEKK